MGRTTHLVEGIILHADSRTVTVRLSSSCKNQCHECGHCSGRSPQAHWDLILTRSRHPLLSSATAGDRLTLEEKLPGTILASLLIFGLPLLISGMSASLSWIITSHEVITLISGGVGFCGSIIPILWIQRLILPGEQGFIPVELHTKA